MMNTYEEKRDYLNQSFLKTMPKGPLDIAKYSKEDEHYDKNIPAKIGHAMEDIISMDYLNEFLDKYVIRNINHPTPNTGIGKVCYRILEDFPGTYFEEIPFEAFIQIIKECGYYFDEENDMPIRYKTGDNKGKLRSLVELDKAGVLLYIDELAAIHESGKILLSKQDYTLALSLANLTTKHQFTKTIFDLIDYDLVTVEYQKEIYWEYRGHKMKGKLDMVITNDSKVGITMEKHGIHIPSRSKVIIDFKSTSFTNIPWLIRKRRDDIQASFYHFGMKQVYPDYNILNPIYLYACMYLPYPIIVDFGKSIREIARFGAEWHYDRKIYKAAGNENTGFLYDESKENYKLSILGWEQMISLYEKYTAQDQWEVDCFVYENNGHILSHEIYQT